MASRRTLIPTSHRKLPQAVLHLERSIPWRCLCEISVSHDRISLSVSTYCCTRFQGPPYPTGILSNFALCVILRIATSLPVLFCYRLTWKLAAWPKAPDSQFAGPSGSSSTAPTATSPFPPKLSRSRTISISATQPIDPSPPSRRSTFDQPSSSLDPRPPPQPFIFHEPNHPRSLPKASSHSIPANPWGVRDGEDVLVEEPIQNYLSHDEGSHSMPQCDLRIFELHGRFSIPTRRVAVRSCGPEEQCESYCRTLWILNTPQTKSCWLHMNRVAAR